MKSRLRKPAEQERAQFAERVKAALAARDMPVSATGLQRVFNERNNDLAISVHAARKWLMGEAIPAQARLRVVAVVLGVSATWLRFGEEAAVKGGKPLSAQEHMLIQHFRSLPAAQKTHLLALVQSMSNLRGKR
jgi:hypothetical protein